MLRKNFMITDKQDKALQKVAKSEGVSASEILRRVIDAYFNKGKEGR